MTKEEMQAIIALQETYIEDLQQDGANTDVAKSVLAKNRAELSYYSVTEELAALRARLAEVEAETKKQKGIIFGERKFSEALCNDLRSKVAEVEAQRDVYKEAALGFRDGLRLIHSGDHEDKPHSVAGHVLRVQGEALAKLEEK
jgi:hypothetical protein